jgi:type I restriction enzyme, S subunit
VTWKEVHLRRIFRIVNGGTPTSNAEYWDGDVPWATPVDIGAVDGKYLASTQRSLTVEGVRTGSRTVPSGSLIISTRAPIGYVAQATVEMAFNQGCRGLVPAISADPRYFRYQLLALRDILVARGAGSTFMELSSDALASVRAACPPLDDQRRIADFLDAETTRIDAIASTRSRTTSLLGEKSLAIIRSALQDGVSPGRSIGASGIPWLDRYPEHWKAVPLRYLSRIQRGASPRPIDDPVYFDDEGSHAWVRISDVTASEKYLEVTEQRLSPLGKSLSVALEPGELFLSIAATVGKPVITRIKCCIHDGFVAVRHLELDKDFLYYIFLLGDAFRGLGKLGTQLNLNSSTVGSIIMPVPPRFEQELIAMRIEDLFEQISSQRSLLDRQVELLAERRQALITAAVTGQIDVTTAHGLVPSGGVTA